MLLYEGGFAHTFGAFDSDNSWFPADSIIYFTLEIKAYQRNKSVRISVEYFRIQFHKAVVFFANIQNNLIRLFCVAFSPL